MSNSVSTNWINVSERLPTENETCDGRVPVLDEDGYLGYAVLISGDKPWLMSEFTVKYWCAVSPFVKDN